MSLPPSSELPSTPSRQSAPIDLARVRRLFARPARLRDSDFLRREIAARMFERLALVKLSPASVLDAGCGEGADLPLLQQRYPEATVLGVDGAPAMLAEAAARLAGGRGALDRLFAMLPGRRAAAGPALACADFACLPLPLHAVDLVWSNLALHWHPQPDRVFAEWRRVLSVEGLLMFSCFGPDTFTELRGAWAAAGLPSPTLPFVDMHDFGDMLVNAGFSTPVMDMERITVTYDSPAKLLAEVAAWGGNPLATQRRGLSGRGAAAKITAALEALRDGGRIPLTYEIVYGHAFRPAPKRTAAGESIIRFDLPKK